jgi:hypothetical protein
MILTSLDTYPPKYSIPLRLWLLSSEYIRGQRFNGSGLYDKLEALESLAGKDYFE